MDFELNQAQAEQFDRDGFLVVDRIVDRDAVDRVAARYEPMFRGEFETGVRPDEVNWQEGRDSPELARQICCGWKADRVISTVVFVALLASVLILFVQVQTDFDGTAIFVVSDEVSDLMPWLILLAAIGSQTSAIIGATMSRSDMLVTNRVPRRVSFVVLLVPAIALFLLTDVSQAVALASRVFAVYFVLQAVIAWILARRAQNWGAVAGFTGIALAMAVVAVFGIPL